MQLVGNTLKPQEFQDLIKSKLKEREVEMLKSQKLIVEAVPEFSQIFEKSQMVAGKISTDQLIQ